MEKVIISGLVGIVIGVLLLPLIYRVCDWIIDKMLYDPVVDDLPK